MFRFIVAPIIRENRERRDSGAVGGEVGEVHQSEPASVPPSEATPIAQPIPQPSQGSTSRGQGSSQRGRPETRNSPVKRRRSVEPARGGRRGFVGSRGPSEAPEGRGTPAQKETPDVPPVAEEEAREISAGAKEKASRKDELREKMKHFFSQQNISRLSAADSEITHLFEARCLGDMENFLLHVATRASADDTGGGDTEASIENALWFLSELLGIDGERAPIFIEPDGDCLFTSFAYSSDPDPNRTKEENEERGMALRQQLVGNAILHIRNLQGEELNFILSVTQPTRWKGDFTKRDLLNILKKFMQHGEWNDNLGDIMPQIVSSFSGTPLFVISQSSTGITTGYFHDPRETFHQPEESAFARVLARRNNHFVPIVVPIEFKDAMIALFRWVQENPKEKWGALQLPPRQENAGQVEEEAVNKEAIEEPINEGAEEPSGQGLEAVEEAAAKIVDGEPVAGPSSSLPDDKQGRVKKGAKPQNISPGSTKRKSSKKSTKEQPVENPFTEAKKVGAEKRRRTRQSQAEVQEDLQELIRVPLPMADHGNYEMEEASDNLQAGRPIFKLENPKASCYQNQALHLTLSPPVYDFIRSLPRHRLASSPLLSELHFLATSRGGPPKSTSLLADHLYHLFPQKCKDFIKPEMQSDGQEFAIVLSGGIENELGKVDGKLQREWNEMTNMTIEDAAYCANPSCDYTNKQMLAESLIQIDWVSNFAYFTY